jgi:hypothetical protein
MRVFSSRDTVLDSCLYRTMRAAAVPSDHGGGRPVSRLSMPHPFFTLRRSLLAIVAVYAGAALYVTLNSALTLAAAALLAVVTLIPPLVLSPLSRAAGHAGAWAAAGMFVWALRLEAFPAGGGAPMTLIPLVLFGWPACFVFGAVAAGVVRMLPVRPREPLK